MPFKVSAEINGAEKLNRTFKRLPASVRKALEVALLQSTFNLHRTALKGIQVKSAGSTSIRYKPKRSVTVSKPGKPPNSDRGILASSIAFNINKPRLRSRVGSNLKYARWLEEGTRHTKARPWLAPAFRKELKKMKKAFRKAVIIGNRKAAKG